MVILFTGRMRSIQILSTIGFVYNFIYKHVSTIKVCFECQERSRIKNVEAVIIGRLCKILNIISECNKEKSDVIVVFCPIVSRAGTDIEATLNRLPADKPTIVFVLHHTFSTDYQAPNSSRYDRNNLMMVDVLFHEDAGLLVCSKNDEAVSKAGSYLKQYAKSQHKVNKCFVIACTVGIGIGVGIALYKAWPRFSPGTYNLELTPRVDMSSVKTLL